jgi:DNA-binding protein YbaB
MTFVEYFVHRIYYLIVGRNKPPAPGGSNWGLSQRAGTRPARRSKMNKIQEAIKRFGFTARENSGKVEIINRKNEVCAKVDLSTKEVTQIYEGQKNLCGALVRKAIKEAIL